MNVCFQYLTYCEFGVISFSVYFSCSWVWRFRIKITWRPHKRLQHDYSTCRKTYRCHCSQIWSCSTTNYWSCKLNVLCHRFVASMSCHSDSKVLHQTNETAMIGVMFKIQKLDKTKSDIKNCLVDLDYIWQSEVKGWKNETWHVCIRH